MSLLWRPYQVHPAQAVGATLSHDPYDVRLIRAEETTFPAAISTLTAFPQPCLGLFLEFPRWGGGGATYLHHHLPWSRNNCSSMPYLRSYVLSTLPHLKSFDFSGVTKLDRSTANVWRRMNIKPKVVRRRLNDY